MDRIDYIQDQARRFGESEGIKTDVNIRFIYDSSADTDIDTDFETIRFKRYGG